MSFDMMVHLPEAPGAPLIARWRAALGQRGLDLDFHPEFRFSQEDAGFLPVKMHVRRPDAFPGAALFSRLGPVHAGFELSLHLRDAAELEEGPAEDPDDNPLAKSPATVIFTLRGRDSAAQCIAAYFCAATLADISGGVFFDPQEGHEWSGAHALAQAGHYLTDVIQIEQCAEKGLPFEGWEG